MMDNLLIEGTKKTPTVHLKKDGQMLLKGRSIPEDPSKFFDIIYRWIEEYSHHPAPLTELNIDLEYFNSGTSKAMLNLFHQFVDLKNKGHQLVIKWHFETGDDDIQERGEYYSTLLDCPFEFIEIEGNE
jgi:hypothetical protein